ncbi:MAG: alpha/beta hydrolase, partial [Suilimivivens sp.]
MISRAVKVADIRKDWAENDRKRDEGLTTPENIIRHDDISYGPYGKWNLLDIYHKKGIKVCQPTIVSIHGGAWVYGTKEIYQYYCMSLAQRGFTVVNFNYRLAPENKYPAALEDINQVFVFLKEHGKEYCVDVKNLFVVGDSAGAQLASQYLTIFTNPKFAEMFDFTIPDVTIRAAALNCGIYDARKCAQYQLDEPFMEYTGKEILTKNYVGKGTMESLDTMKYMTSDFPPAFIMSAYYDFLLENAEPMYQHLKSL